MSGRSGKSDTIALVTLLVLAAFFRFWAAPLSAGQDVAQFWAFAQVFHTHGLDFYRYADATLDIFPYWGWGFFYPPVWLLVLGLALLFVPESLVAGHMIDTGWRVAMKTPIITADLAIGLLIYWAVPGSRLRKLLFSCLWFFHPTAWYESAVFGQFDAIAAAFLLTAVILLMRSYDRLAFFMAGLAVMTKQHTLIPVALMVIVSTRQLGKTRLATDCGILVGTMLVISLPFIVTGNFGAYVHSIIFASSTLDYQGPLSFAFSGSGALLTQLHIAFGWETIGLFKLSIPLLIAGLAIAAVLGYRKRITPLQAALVGFLLFVSLFYRINYQYVVVFIPLAILQAGVTHHRLERVLALSLAMLPAAWLWLANIPFWFNDHDPTNPWVTPLLGKFGLLERYMPDYVYVALAVAVMCLALTYVVLTFTSFGPRVADSPGGNNSRV